MKPYAVIDLHCDTLTSGSEDVCDTLNDKSCSFALDKIPDKVKCTQFFAIYIPDKYSKKTAIDYFESNYRNFCRQIEKFADRIYFCKNINDMESAIKNNKCAAFLTIENGNVLAGDIRRVALLARLGVRVLTLVWNGENEIASGSDTNNGLSDFGKAVIPELEKNGIIIDVSHLNDVGFFEFIKLSNKPFMATHSNARSVCSHKRNLTDEMIKEIVDRKGLIGLNYYADFICDDKDLISFDDIFRHIERFFMLGAKDCLALGSDFDGADIPECINLPTKVIDFYDYLTTKITKEEADAIFYHNAQRFIKNNM